MNSFQFASMMHQLPRCVNTEFLVPFNICSLFTNIPLDETISICASLFLYCSCLKSQSFPECIFIELMELATKSVSFSFQDTMYYQVDGISMTP